MEVKINREIRAYTESLFFGLSLRQFFFSVLAVGAAIGLYFGLRSHLGVETVSWLCVLGAAPCAALGFIQHHGMTAEQWLWAYIKSEFLMPRRLVFHPKNSYYEALRGKLRQRGLEETR
ncbi:PrgI family protein [Cohnella rhizosphaerae]|uniref:PrgI family protein n=1 Tax=Cohnella rhizosphaerae TaxID=1457232 RepID=A0A9X4KU62_9BACL|nr:PrgI family protein [Cohnella rhizosphaerae]MDG0810331.1 PrgI family protein [Cohnella rhizosphaerae]